MAHDGHVSPASASRQHDKEPSLESPRCGSLRTGIASGNIDHSNNRTGRIETIVASHGGTAGGDRIYRDTSDPTSARTNKRARAAGRADKMRERPAGIGIWRYPDWLCTATG